MNPLHWLGASCEEASRRSSDYLDDEIAWLPRLRIRIHLSICAMCREVYDQMLAIQGALRQLGEGVDGLDPAARQALLDEFRKSRVD